MSLRDGFYLYIISTIWNGKKIQTVKMFFDCRCNVVRIPLFDEDEFSLLCLDHQNYSIQERSEEELMGFRGRWRNPSDLIKNKHRLGVILLSQEKAMYL